MQQPVGDAAQQQPQRDRDGAGEGEAEHTGVQGGADGIQEGLKHDHGILPRRIKGLPEARWILMDYLDVVVHVFTPDVRDHYRLEALWGDVPRSDPDPQELLEELPVESAAS